jgi:hypothetical protein
MEALGNYIADKRPDKIICLGDWFDLESLSSHSMPGEKEGLRYKKDIDAGIAAMERLCAPIRAVRNYHPEMILTLGNHEDRIRRTVEDNPQLKGFMSTDDLQLERFGWRVYPFLHIAKRNGIAFSHYFQSGAMGRPASSPNAVLKEFQHSAVQGHRQDFSYAVHPKTQRFCLFAGIFYLEQFKYLGQGNTSRPQVHMLHEVHDGISDIMTISADYLLRNWL